MLIAFRSDRFGVRRVWRLRRAAEPGVVEDFVRLNAPFVSLIEGAADLSDRWFLDRLGLRPPKRTGRERGRKRHVLIGEVGSWKLLADTYWYEFWFNDATRPLLVELSADRTVFSYHFGDSDDSHAIRVLRNGEIEREWIVGDHFGGGAAIGLVESGKPLDGERGIFSLNEECAPYFRRLASAYAGSIEDGLLTARAWAVSVDRLVDPNRAARLQTESWSALLS